MYRVELPQRTVDDPALTSPAYRSQTGYWWEGMGYEITQAQASDLRQAACEMLARYDDAMNYVVGNAKILRQFYFSEKPQTNRAIQQLAADSWNNPAEKGYVLDRWDIGWDGVSPPKVLERNFGHLGLIVGTGIVQPEYLGWLKQQPGYDDVEAFGDLRLEFIRALNEVALHRGIASGESMIVIVQANRPHLDKGMVEAGNVLGRWIDSAGYSSTLLPATRVESQGYTFAVTQALSPAQLKKVNVTASHDVGIVTAMDVTLTLMPGWCSQEDDSMRRFAVHPFFDFDSFAYDYATNIKVKKTLNYQPKITQPFWTLLMGHKSLLPILHQLFPDHPNFLPAVAGNKGIKGQKGFVKHVNEHQGFGAKVISAEGRVTNKRKDDSCTSADYRGSKHYITQAYCDGVRNPDGSHKVMHMFTTNGRPAAIGMREGPEPFVGGDNTKTQFLPIIVRKQTSGTSTYSYEAIGDDPLDLSKGDTCKRRVLLAGTRTSPTLRV